MDFKTGRPNHIEDYLSRLHFGSWFKWTDPKNKVYANIVLTEKVHNPDHGTDFSRPELTKMPNPHSIPTEQECIDGLAKMQTDFDNEESKKETDKTNANNKLKALGLTDDEIKEIKGII